MRVILTMVEEEMIKKTKNDINRLEKIFNIAKNILLIFPGLKEKTLDHF